MKAFKKTARERRMPAFPRILPACGALRVSFPRERRLFSRVPASVFQIRIRAEVFDENAAPFQLRDGVAQIRRVP